MNAKVIGLCGLAGSGKDTLAKRLIGAHGYAKASFARALKAFCAEVFGWDADRLDDLEYKEAPSGHGPVSGALVLHLADASFEAADGSASPKDLEHVYNMVESCQPEWTRRRILQVVGTEGFRTADPDHWVNHAKRDARVLLGASGGGAAGVVFTDLRFPNEEAAVRELGGIVVRLVREGGPEGTKEGSHASERGIMALHPDVVVRATWGDLGALSSAADFLVGALWTASSFAHERPIYFPNVTGGRIAR